MDIMIMPTALIAAGSAAAWLLRHKPCFAAAVGSGTLCGSSAAGIILLVMQFISCGSCSLRDLFALPVLILSAASAIHSIGYLAGHGSERSGSYWFFLNMTAASMLAVTWASTALGFLVAWEIMGLASAALVLFDRHNSNSSRAAWIYLIACHAGAAILIILFYFPFAPEWVFILALIGFGLKIGFPLLHVWLPEAHPAAPAPVSALMSGAMIELGFYGLLVFGILREGSCIMYGWTLTVIGVISALGGIIFALAQSNLKRMLAYSSIENMGILSSALGMGFLGLAYQLPEMYTAAFAGAVIHLINHAFFKGGLFLAAGSVYKQTGTLDMDEMGGLLKRMPWTGTLFILHSSSLCGLPPFAGFVGEFFIYYAAFAGLGTISFAVTAISSAVLILLALTGGLAAASFAKAAGTVFCGEPRSRAARDSAEVPFFMTLPVLVLFLASNVMMFLIPAILSGDTVSAAYGNACDAELIYLAEISSKVIFVSALAVLIFCGLCFWRIFAAKSCGERKSATWDCGYSRPSSSMEYTATSFSQNQTDFFSVLLRPERKMPKIEGAFPSETSFEENIPDAGEKYIWRKIFLKFSRAAEKIHSLQSGSIHFYLLAIVITLIGMLIFAVTGE